MEERGVKTMYEKKKEIIEAIGEEIPDMAEKDKAYLIGFLEGMAAAVGNQQFAESKPSA